MSDDISKKLRDWDAAPAIQECATNKDDAAFYMKGACVANSGACPFQSLKYKVPQDDKKLPACEMYHPKLKKKE